MALPLHKISFRYAKHLVTARYIRIDDVRPAKVEIHDIYFGGEPYTREDAEALQFGNDQCLWDETDHRAWLDAYGPSLPELKRVSIEIADAEHLPEFQAAMAHAKRIAAE